jgi:addiction module HigA family antidote
MTRDFKPVLPGVILKEIIDELGISQARLARDIAVSSMRVSHVVGGSRPITADMALRLGRYFSQSPQYWLNLQASFDMQIAHAKIGKRLKAIHPCKAA